MAKTIKDIKDALLLKISMADIVNGNSPKNEVNNACMNGFNLGVAATFKVIREYANSFGKVDAETEPLAYRILEKIEKEELLLKEKWPPVY